MYYLRNETVTKEMRVWAEGKNAACRSSKSMGLKVELGVVGVLQLTTQEAEAGEQYLRTKDIGRNCLRKRRKKTHKSLKLEIYHGFPFFLRR